MAPVVLVVDDEPLVLRMTARMLLDAGYSVRSAGSGPEALALACALPCPPALLVTDVRMAPIDGPHLAREMREHYPGISILYVSGYPADPDHPHGDAPFLKKPFKAPALLAIVSQLLARSAA